jgi:acetate kinase
LKSVSEVAAIGFKAVFAGNLSGIRVVDEPLLVKMEELADIAPAHNPMYAMAMRQLRSGFPEIPLVASLETSFHDTVPPANRCYAVPYEWFEQYEICRWGYHGASHRYLSVRMAELLGRQDLKLITCHLGGSNSLCAIRHGVSIANTLGMSPQSGLPHNNRVGDFDPFALPVLMRATGKSLEELLQDLSNKSGLLGLSGLSSDVRDLEQAAAEGHTRAQLALDVFISSIRQYLGAYLVLLEGADAIVFSGGIGENSRLIRSGVCRNLEWAGVVLDPRQNEQARGECRISTAESRIPVWVVPTNEELIVARQAAEALGLAVGKASH